MRGSHEIRNHHIEKQHERGPGEVRSRILSREEMDELFASFPPPPPRIPSRLWTTAKQRSMGKTLKDNWG